MKPFHIFLHRLPAESIPGPVWPAADGDAYETLDVPRHLQNNPIGGTFEDTLARLDRLPRMFVELDGSFVWVGPPKTWQLDGILIDRESKLVYVELKGSCPVDAFCELTGAIGISSRELMIQMVREAIFFSEPEFRRLAWPGLNGEP